MVSSDIRPVNAKLKLHICKDCGTLQKIADEKWQSIADKLYAEYAINHHAGGSDPVIFSPYGTMTRSEAIFNSIPLLPKFGKLLDVGCGNGNFLWKFSEEYPSWSLYALEKDDTHKKRVMEIDGIKGFFTDIGQLNAIKFDIIVLSGVLEHIPHPVEFLKKLSKYLSFGGKFVISVPNIRNNPVDMLVFDHCQHFDETTFRGCLAMSGLAVESVCTKLIPKELVAVASVLPPLESLIERHIGECQRMRVNAKASSVCNHRQLGIMGTAVAAMWLAQEIGDELSFFVDEDISRTGNNLLGKPIYRLEDIPEKSKVFMPMPKEVREKIIERAAKIREIKWDWA